MKDSAFCDPHLISMKQLLARIRAADDLAPNRKREITSAISVTAKWFNLPLDQIIAHPRHLRMLFNRITPATAGVGKKRFSNVRSAIMYAMRYADILDKKRYLAPFTPSWQKLWDEISDPHIKAALSRFLRFLSAQNIKPGKVDDKVMEQFLDALTNDSLVKRPAFVHQNACRTWNRLASTLDAWPNNKLKVLWRRDQYKLPRETFPQAFHTDMEAYFARQTCDDPFNRDAPVRPLRKASIESYRESLYRFASTLVHTGHDPARITSLAYLVQPDHVEQGLRYLLEKRKRPPRQHAANTAFLLAKVARHWVKADETNVKIINGFGNNLNRATDGISEKSKERLKPFRDEKNLALLFLLPDRIASTVEKEEMNPRRAALLMQQAVAISILSNCPLRMKNLSEIRLDHHLSWSGKNMSGKLTLDFSKEEVKNRQFLSFPLPTECAHLIRLYIRKYRDNLLMPPSPFLFPGKNPDRCKQRVSLSVQITKLTHQTIGYKVNPHLFRHLVHLIVLRQFPSAYGMVSRILGHKSLQTTLSNYAHEDVAIAMEVYQELVTGKSNPLLQKKLHKPDSFARSLNRGFFK